MATYGKIEEFDSVHEDWPEYVERLGFFFDANGIGDDADKKRAVFLTVVGATTYKLLRSLVSPSKPGEKSYADLITVLSAHFNPPPSVIVQRFKFHTRCREPGESVAVFVSQLRSLSEHCKFGTTLEDMLRDRIVCGINDNAIQKRLLAEPELSFKKAVELAQGMETAARDAKELQKPTSTRETCKETTGVLKINPSSNVKSPATCHRCGKPGHLASRCAFKQAKCYHCGKTGHLRSVCRSKRKGPGKQHVARPVRIVQTEEEEDDMDSNRLNILQSRSSVPPLKVTVELDNHPIAMEVDTGAAFSMISESTFKELWPSRSLSKEEVRLCTYSGEPIQVLGSLTVAVSYRSQQSQEPLLVVKGDGPSLLGRNWMNHIQLDWKQINQVRLRSLHAVLQQHEAVFQGGLGVLKGYQARILVDSNTRPRFFKARSVPYAYRDMVEKELDRLVSEGILEPVQYADWASPIVPVLKSDKKSMRICGDFKQTINPVSPLDRYPIPKVEDLFATLSGGRLFSKIDLSQAYQQVPLDMESRQYVVINTLKGLFRYTRLPYGVSSAPGIFQRLMENLLQGLPGVIVYIDDILIAGASQEEHLERLKAVLCRLEEAGLRAQRSKCKFMASSVTFLGHRVDSEGVHPLPEKVKAVSDAPCPQNVQELKSYLGLLSYYSKFIPNMSSSLAPLYRLLRKDIRWSWAEKEEEAFKHSKELLTSSPLLTHFDPTLPLVLACDASAFGIGAVLAHKLPDGSERPIGYASRSLSKAERNYSQLEKEGLSCIFGVKRFHSYIFGHHFLLLTDHKPLLALLNEYRSTSPQASARIRRWSLHLAAYEYTLKFRDTLSHSNADALSRLPLPVVPAESDPPPEVILLMEHLAESPVTAQHIRSGTRKDPLLSSVAQYVRRGWPASSSIGPELSPFFNRRLELTQQDGCLLWGSRVIVPPLDRKVVLDELHEAHPGMTRMKALARMFVWWPGIDNDIERSVRLCHECQSSQSSPPVAPLHPWHWPTRPWTRLHIDYAGPLRGRMILIVVDAHSKWIEAFPVPSATSSATIEKLRTLFAQFGLPETVVSDNAPYFMSQEFETFLKQNGIRHPTSAAYHPSSNGLAERGVQVVKHGLKKVKESSLESRIAKVLFTYRTTPHATTGRAPAELLFGRIPRTRLDLLFPDPASRVEEKQAQQKRDHDQTARERTFVIGQPVLVRNFPAGDSWIPAQVMKLVGPLSFIVQLENGRQVKRHQDHIRQRLVSSEHSSADILVPDGDLDTESFPLTAQSQPTDSPPARVVAEPSSQSSGSMSDQSRRYPQRQRKAPDRFQNSPYSLQ